MNPLSTAFVTVESVGAAMPYERHATLKLAFSGPDAAQRAHAARDHIEALRAMIKECGEQFRFYQKNHEAKGTPDSDAKAKVNAEIAARCEALVSG